MWVAIGGVRSLIIDKSPWSAGRPSKRLVISYYCISYSFVANLRLVDSGQFFHHHPVLHCMWPWAKVSSFASQGDLFYWSSHLDLPPGSDREADTDRKHLERDPVNKQ